MKKARSKNDDYCPLCLMIEEAYQMRLTVPYDEIVNAGISLPPAELLTDEQIIRKIDEVIGALAGMNTCVTFTDHLSDRELYRVLCDDVLREEAEVFDRPGAVTTIDLIGGGSAEDIEIYLTYYADDETRKMWEKDFPEDPLPEKKPLPHDRDRFLPSLETLTMDSRGH